VRLSLILALSSAFFKSYSRSSNRNSSVASFLKPKIMLAIDIALFVFPAILSQYISSVIPADIEVALAPLVIQAMISLPLLLTSAVIVSGLMFELGQGSAISSSEAVNWWPVTPREYVAASSLSTSTLYSAFLAVSAGVMLPLSIKFDLFYAWPLTTLLCLLGLFLGAFIVEFLKAIVNRVSAVAYKKSGRVTLALRLIVLVFIFAVFQLAFQPYALAWFFGSIAAGVETIWMMPFVWSSAAVVNLIRYEIVQSSLFALLSLLFTIALYEISCQLRGKFWSPVPISISIAESKEYIPKGSTGNRFGFNSLASLLALKEFRALTRRKDLARFIAIPIMITVSLLAPILASPGEMSGRGPGFFLAVMIPFIVPLMFATISIGQEGASITHLLCLPVKPNDLIKGKLAPAWLVTSAITFPLIALMEILVPIGLTNVLATGIVSLMAIAINGFIGLGVGARWPDFTIGARARFVSLKGFLVGFILSGLATLAVYAPVAAYIVTSGGVQGEVPSLGLELLPMLTISTIVGSALAVLAYLYCRRGIENLLTNV
jgi:hypothetical protein